MKHPLFGALLIAALAAFGSTSPLRAAPSPAEGELFDFSSGDPSLFEAEKGASMQVSKEGVKIEFPAGGYPGITLNNNGGEPRDLSAFRAVEAEVTNDSGVQMTVCLRVDNQGKWQDSPWSVGVVKIPPGATQTIRTTFGESYGKPGFALDPVRIVRIKLFVDSPTEAGVIRLGSLRAVK